MLEGLLYPFYLANCLIATQMGFYSAAEVLFSPKAPGWVGRMQEKSCPGYISETLSGRMLILGRDIG